jgi:hypothetical protein
VSVCQCVAGSVSVVGWLRSCAGRLVCALVCAFVSAFACSFRGLFACVLSWVEFCAREKPFFSDVSYTSTYCDAVFTRHEKYYPKS